ncbi:MAG: 50S ribosomal protein L11 methyltransferase [Lentisphaeraceae bacterium]|nr:50S ribosomal protein L11 methyltransferase [Lentisphaeraceae bacterium]
MSDILYAVTVKTDAQTGALIDEMLPTLELLPTSYFDRREETAHLNLYFETPEESQQANSLICKSLTNWQQFFDLDLSNIEVISHEIKKEDWTETWKAFFHVFKASDRLVVKPSWEEYEEQEGDLVIEIDPGMSFGTGNHGTTKACLQFLDEVATGEEKTFMDMGCGSGILSMGASKLGYKSIEAFDYDPDAVRIAGENLVLAKCLGVKVFQQDLSEYAAETKFDVVVANILAVVLKANASRIVAALKEGSESRLVLSGILHEQYGEIKEEFTKVGLKEVQCKQIGEWSSGLFAWK